MHECTGYNRDVTHAETLLENDPTNHKELFCRAGKESAPRIRIGEPTGPRRATSYISVGKLSSCSRLGDQLHENLISSVKFAEMVP